MIDQLRENTLSVVVPCRWHEPTFQNRANNAVLIGRQVFSNTNLVLQGEVTESDVAAVAVFFDQLLTNEEGKWDGFLEHCRIASRIGYELAIAVNQRSREALNPNAHACALWLHDLGRVASHAFMETDVLTGILWEKIGLRKDLHDLTHDAHLYWDDDPLLPESLTAAKKISIIADTGSKRSSLDSKRLRLAEEILPEVRAGKQKYLSRDNPSLYERQLVEKLPTYTQKEELAICTSLAWLASLGINVNAILSQINIVEQV